MEVIAVEEVPSPPEPSPVAEVIAEGPDALVAATTAEDSPDPAATPSTAQVATEEKSSKIPTPGVDVVPGL